MRILHITSHLNVGGITSYVLSLSRACAARGHRVVIASGGGQLEAQAQTMGVTHWRVPLQTSAEWSPRVWMASRQLRAKLRQEPVDVIHAHTRVSQVAAQRLARWRHIPYVATWHGFFRPNLGRRLWPCTGDVTVAISEPVRQHLLHVFRVPETSIRLIPNGIDPTPFESPADPADQQRLREQLRLPSDGPVVGTVARLVASKGIEQLIRGFARVRASAPHAHLLIVGDGTERTHLEQEAIACGVREAVHFAGTLTDTHVALSLMHVFVFLPAQQEGFGLSLLEAMASGRPIVAIRRGGGAVWVLEQGGIGTLVEPGDPSGLASAIIRVLQDGEAACREAGKARAIVKERYSISRMVDAVEAVYRELI